MWWLFGIYSEKGNKFRLFSFNYYYLDFFNIYFFGVRFGSSSSLCSSCSNNESGCRTAPGLLFRCHVKTLANCMNFFLDRLPICLSRSVNTKSSTLLPFSSCSFSNASIKSWFHFNSFMNSSFCNIIANCSSGISKSLRPYRLKNNHNILMRTKYNNK